MNKLTIEQCERVIANHKSGVQMTSIALYQQLADTMRREERLRAALIRISAGLHPDLNSYEDKWTEQYFDIANEALSNKESK